MSTLLYGTGYYHYSNPYYVPSTTVVQQTVVYDYSQPLVVDPGQPEIAVTETSQQTSDQALQLFKQGDYAGALKSIDAAIKEAPNDAALHEFRALVLFALERYPESAATIYPVLSVGPGWDWTTLVGLYPSVDVYTEQLRKLETFRKAHDDSPDAAFLLGYHYMTCGHPEAAAAQFRHVVELLPSDALAKQFADSLDPEYQAKVEAAVAATPPAASEPGELPGTWKASRGDEQFLLVLNSDMTYLWSYSNGTDKAEYKGKYTEGGGVLTLIPEGGGAMVAELTWESKERFQFRLVGEPPTAAGLVFSK